MMVDVKFIKKFKKVISLEEIKNRPELANMLVIKKGMRLSIQPVSESDYNIIAG